MHHRFQRFLFSNEKAYRAGRHLLFWVVFCVDFLIQVIAPKAITELKSWNIYKYGLINLFCYLPVAIFSVYTSIYFLAPRFFYRKKYWHFSFGLLLLLAVDIALAYVATNIYLKQINFPSELMTFLHKIDFALLFTIWVITATLVALGIKIARRWYFQQKENLEINKRKLRMDLQLQKANLQPTFLFQTLESIRGKVMQENDAAGSMVIKLSDILSYSLYDSDAELVPIEMELSFLQEFIELQHMQNKEVNIFVNSQEVANDAYIPPMILLSLLQQCIAMLNNNDASGKIVISTNVVEGKLAIMFNISYSTEIIAQNLKALRDACNRMGSLFSQDDYRADVMQDRAGISAILYVPLITDPFTFKPGYEYQLNALAHESA